MFIKKIKLYKRYITEKFDLYCFKKNGYIPWTKGYERYKWNAIKKIISHNHFYELIGTEKFGYRIDERIVELPWLVNSMSEKEEKFLDAGSALNHSCILEHPKFENKKIFISTLAPEGNAFWEKGISYIYEDLRDSSFKDSFFDTISCISTIEHIGMDNTSIYTSDVRYAEDFSQYGEFLIEMKRILKPNGKIFLSFPFGIRKDREWFCVFDDEVVNNMIKIFDPSVFKSTYFKYENDRWNLSTQEACIDCTCYDLHAGDRQEIDSLAFSRAVCCLEFTK